MQKLSRGSKISQQKNRRQSQRIGGRPKPKPEPLTLITGVDGSFCAKKSEDDCKKIKACDWLAPNARQKEGYCRSRIDRGTSDSSEQYKEIEAKNEQRRAKALVDVYNTSDDEAPIQSRKPIAHESYWEEKYEDNITPEQRAVLADTRQIANLQNYDTVINSAEAGYRNQGVFIYYNNGLHHLSRYPDDYGSLPEWVVTRKEDCGYSYFSDALIDHNEYVPFKTSNWKIGPSKIMDASPFKYAYTYVDVTTKLMRKDGAKCDLVVPVMISAPWLGGPKDDVKSRGGSGNGDYYAEYLQCKNGDNLELKYKYDIDGNQILLQPPQSAVVIPNSVLENAEKLVNDCIKAYFKATEYVYFNANGPCHFNDDNVLTDKSGFKKVIVLESVSTKTQKRSRSICPSFKSEDNCSVNPECKWISSISKCRKAPTKRVSNKTTQKRPRSICPSLKLEDNCVVNPECKWRKSINKCRKAPAKQVSKSKQKKQKGYGFELRFGLNKSIIPDDLIKKYGKKLEQDLGKTLYDNGEKWNWSESGVEVEDVSKLSQKIKDFLTEDLLQFMESVNRDNYNQVTYDKAVFGQGKNYISVKGYAEHPLNEIMDDVESLASHIEVINEKSIWQSFYQVYPIDGNKLYEYSSVFLYGPDGQAIESNLF